MMACFPCIHSQEGGSLATVEVRDDGLYSFVCDLGHETITQVQQQPFEMLFEIGANAILDGYYREAVSSFAASLERFYEFSTLCLFLHNGQTAESFKRVWKPLRKSSERQCGAFVATWASTYGEVPALMPENRMGKQFRNSVVHDGRIPSRREAIEFGQMTMRLLRSQVAQLKSRALDSVHSAVFVRLREMSKDAGAVRPSTMSVPTIVSLNQEDVPDATLDQLLESLQSSRRVMNAAIEHFRRQAVLVPPDGSASLGGD